MNATRFAVMAAFVALFGMLTGCTRAIVYKESKPDVVVIEKQQKSGPPPHAPAHGYRHKHGDCELKYDNGIDVYVVVGEPNCYFSAGQFFRFESNTWQWSVQVDGPYKVVASYTDVPGSLVKKHGKGQGYDNSKKKKGKGKNKK